MTVRRRFLSPLWLIAALPVYMGWRLLPALASGPTGIVIGTLILLAACIVIPASVRRTDRFAWVGLTAMGLFSTLFVATVLRDLFLILARGFVAAPQWHAMLTPSARFVVAAALLMSFFGFIVARRPRLVEVDVPIAHLPAALHGFLIAQISDVHVGPTIKRGFVERLVGRVNALEADLIAVTGDLVDGSVQQLALHTAPLAKLKARHGSYFVTGNHEYYSGEHAWTQEIRRLGLTVLKNQHVVLDHDGAALVLAGVNDVSAHHFDPGQRSDPEAALRGAAHTSAPKILLAHQPSSAEAAASAGFDLQISGHTHGGQFWPWNYFVRYFQPFTAGLHRLKNLWVYVSRGTGYWGPPTRFGVPSEITRIRLVTAAASIP